MISSNCYNCFAIAAGTVLLCFSFTTLPSDLNARTGGPDA